MEHWIGLTRNHPFFHHVDHLLENLQEHSIKVKLFVQDLLFSLENSKNEHVSTSIIHWPLLVHHVLAGLNRKGCSLVQSQYTEVLPCPNRGHRTSIMQEPLQMESLIRDHHSRIPSALAGVPVSSSTPETECDRK